MNKLLALLLVTLLVSQASANFLKLGLFDNGEDHGEDSGVISGSWNDRFLSDNGEVVDSGEFSGRVIEHDNGEIEIYGNYSRYFLNRFDSGEQEFFQTRFSDSGEFSHIGRRQQEKSGPITQDEVAPLVIKRLRQKNIE